MATTIRFMIAEELEQSPSRDGLWEVIDGELVDLTGTGGKHAVVTLRVILRLGNFVTPQRLGTILLPESSIALAEGPLVLRLPDTGFIRAERLPLDQIPDGYIRVVPDLVVEVRSPGDAWREVLAKGTMWLTVGAALVWLFDPVTESVTELAREQPPRQLTREHVLDGGNVLPGFCLPVGDLFAD